MVKKRVDPRVKGLIEYGVQKNHRSMFVLVGDHGKDQVENLHRILSRCRVKARPSVLWCYKKELGFSTHRQKRIKEIKRNQARGLHDPDRDDPFDLFISSTDIRWMYYKESEKVLGQTFGMCVLQDFEALTPNLLARTIETVEGGGLVILLLKTVKSLRQLYSLTMDVHSRFRTEAHHEIVPRFNERFILSLGECAGCLVLDDELNILPISSTVNHVPSSGEARGGDEEDGDESYALASAAVENPQLRELKLSLSDTPNIGALVAVAKTLDQANAVMSFLDAISESSSGSSLRGCVSLTASRGRGKSAAIGLCLAGAVSYGYANIFVTAPSPENLKTVFEFVVNGLKALKYTEHIDYELISQHNEEIGKVVVRVNIFREHRQCIQYILPTEDNKLAQAELVAIDEAAAIPLPTVKKLMNAAAGGSYLCFLSSTVNGYEGTGRSLSLKLIQQLRQQQGSAMAAAAKSAGAAVSGPRSNKGERHLHEDRWKAAASAASSAPSVRKLTELSLDEPIRYGSGDPIEKWLNSLLCLDSSTSSSQRLVHVMPSPAECELYMVNRDALFSYHALSEQLLQRIWALYTAAHYKNTPNDLQLLSDAPAHRLFVLLGPQRASNSSSGLPDVLCVVQVAFEGFISQATVQSEIARGNKASGDLIPWTVSQQFNDLKFAGLSGARVVRIATHPDVQKMGYGGRAMDLLIEYFAGNICVMSEAESPDWGKFGGEGAPGDEVASAATDEASGDLRNEALKPRKKLPPLLTALVDRPAERLHWLGVSFGLTSQLLNFWSKKGFKACYLRQTKNELTGEHSCIVLRELEASSSGSSKKKSSSNNSSSSSSSSSSRLMIGKSGEMLAGGWLDSFVSDYRRRLVSLMSYSFNTMETALAITLIDPDRVLTTAAAGATGASAAANDEDDSTAVVPSSSQSSSSSSSNKLTANELVSVHLTQHDLQRLELYSRNLVDHHMILDTLPILTRLLFLQRIEGIRLSFLQIAIILAVGLQHRDVDSVAAELNIPVNQVLAFFNQTVKKITKMLDSLVKADIERSLTTNGAGASSVRAMEKRIKGMDALNESLAQDQQQDEREFAAKTAATAGSKAAAAAAGGAKANKELNKHLDKAQRASDALDRVLAEEAEAPPSRISVAVPAPVPTSDASKKSKKDNSFSDNKKRKQTLDSNAEDEEQHHNEEDDAMEVQGAQQQKQQHQKKHKKHKKDRRETVN